MLVMVGVGADRVLAAGPAPSVSASVSQSPLLAGEEGTLDLGFRNSENSGDFNLSVGIVAPVGIKATGFGDLGAPTKTYTRSNGNPIPGNYTADAQQCAAMGLVSAANSKCAVPEGSQYFVFMNISDLPNGARNSAQLSFLPDSDIYDAGTEIPFVVSAVTSSRADLLPRFPGTTSVASVADDYTSANEPAEVQAPVEALRITKRVANLPEDELLRGVHQNRAEYVIEVEHTGEGDVTGLTGGTGVEVVDYLPAMLEYLACGTDDHTENANGNEGHSVEYPGAPRLTAGASITGNDCGAATSVDTVMHDGAVHTKVAWNLGTLGAGANGGVPQNFEAGTPGTPGTYEIRYLAGVPLFENALWPDDSAPTAASGEQGSNLDNNTGASTRQGQQDSPWDAEGATNTAETAGAYTLKHPATGQDPVHISRDDDTRTVDVLDVRLLKSVDDGHFQQARLARYTLDITTSEYVNAELGEGGSSSIRPNRLVDDLGDGICPAIPENAPITPNASQYDGLPRLILGNPKNPDSVGDDLTRAEWNAALSAAAGDCSYWSTRDGATLEGQTANLDGTPTGSDIDASLTGIAYDDSNGHFFLDLHIGAMEAGQRVLLTYTATQNTNYAQEDGQSGVTSSGDRVYNDAEIVMTTTPFVSDDVDTDVVNGNGVGVDDDLRAHDDSRATVSAPESEMSKEVLPRSVGAVSAADIATTAGWVEDEAPEPFAAGDRVWFKIHVVPPARADVRNAKLTDYLPQGLKIAGGELVPGENYVVKPASGSLNSIGACTASDGDWSEAAWLDKFVPTPSVTGQRIDWTLGANDCVAGNTDDFFMPSNTNLDFYIQAVVTGTSAAGEVDLPLNQAKYQQQGRDGDSDELDIFFARDEAGIELVATPTLIKGIETNSFDGITGLGADGWKGAPSGANQAAAPNYSAGTSDNAFGSNVDDEYAVQQDDITFRIDVTAPLGNEAGAVTTRDYVVWDALPKGVTKADVDASSFAALLCAGADEASIECDTDAPLESGDFTAEVLNPGDDGYPANIRVPSTSSGSVIKWTMHHDVAGSQPGALQGFSLFYTLRVPSGVTDGGAAALMQQKYTNTAGIVEYGVANTGDTADEPETSTLVPFESGSGVLNTTEQGILDASNFTAPFAETQDTSGFQLPNAAMKKTRVSTEHTANGNAEGQIVQGEYATYDISVRIPANTTVREGVLFDEGVFRGFGGGSISGANPANTVRYELKSASVAVPAGVTAPTHIAADAAAIDDAFQFNTSSGKLIFPTSYSSGDSDREFSVTLELWVKDIGETNATGVPNIPNNKGLRNSAHFDSKSLTGTANPRITGTADVTYVEPQPTLAKTASELQGAGRTVTFTLTAGNASNAPVLYDSVVYDCLPASFEEPQGGWNFSATSAKASDQTDGKCRVEGSGAGQRVIPDEDGTGTLIEWAVGDLAQGTANRQTLTFDAVVNAAAGGNETYTNRAHIIGFTLPDTVSDADRRGDRATGAAATVRIPTATLTKSVDPESAPIGEKAEYTVSVAIPADANYYSSKVVDTLPVGVEYVPGTTRMELRNGSEILDSFDVDPAIAAGTGGAQVLTWGSDDFHIARADTPRTLVVTYEVRITDDIGAANTLTNSAVFTWNTAANGNGRDESTDPGTADLGVLHPLLGIDKQVKHAAAADSTLADAKSGNPDQRFSYRVEVSNIGQATANRTPAHDITVTDVVPAGVVIDESTFRIDGNAVATPNSVSYDQGSRTITWTLAGPLYPQEQAGETSPQRAALSYDATFVPSAQLTPGGKTNTATVTEFSSCADGFATCDGDEARTYVPGQNNVPAATDSATVTPLFPSVVPEKTTTDPEGLAYVDTPFNWTLRISNEGTGIAQSVTVADELPPNWEYVGNPKIRIGTAEPVDLAAPTLGTSADANVTLSWSAAQLAAAGATPLAAGAEFTITFDAKPTDDALTTPGTGLEVNPHTNTMRITATDTTGASENGAGDRYVPTPEDTADAHIAEADLLLVKDAIGGVVEQDDADENLYGLDAGTWVPGQAPLPSGDDQSVYAQPKWRITVTNHGPDASSGPFELVDTQTLPDGVTVSGWTARYYPAGGGTPTDLSLSGSGTAQNPFIVGDDTVSLNAAGTDRIVILGNVSVGAAALAQGNDLMNVASVDGATFERPSKKDPDSDHPNEDDESKPLETRADLAIEKSVTTPEADRGAGKPISWDLQVTNLGPSNSLSGTEKITVSDEVPEGVFGVADPSNSTWAATTSNGWPAKAGDTITWTYQGAAIAPGASIATITLSGTVDPARVADVANTASVVPGDTEDPDLENNEDGTTVPLSTDTALSIDKTRVVQNGSGEWVAAGGLDPVPAPVPGEHVSYRITVTNNGPAVARGVHVVDHLPSYLSYVSATDEVGTWAPQSVTVGQSGDVRFNLTDPAPLASPVGLAADDTLNTVSFILTTQLDSNFVLDDDSEVVNEATADADNADPDTDDDRSNTPSRDARLVIEKTHSGDPIAGTAIPYTLTVTNSGPSASRGAIDITDQLPEGLSYVANSARISVSGGTATAQEPTISNGGRDLAWTVGSSADTFTLPVDSTIVVTLDVLIDANISNGVKQNTATVDGPDGPRDDDTDEVTIERQADMTLVKKVEDSADVWVDEAGAVAGETKRYLLTVTNSGPSANPATLVDALPEHLTLVSVSPVDAESGWDCSASIAGSQTATCGHAQLPVGTTEIVVVAKLAPNAVAGAGGQQADFENTATLSWTDRRTGDSDDPHTSVDDAIIHATAEADLVLQKRSWEAADEEWVDSAQATAGTEARFRIDVRNDGPSDVIAPVRVEDVLPQGITFDRLIGDDTLRSWQAEPGEVDPDTGTQTVVFTAIDEHGEQLGLNSGQSLPPLRYAANVAPSVPSEASLVNTAEVTSGTTERNPDNNRDDAEVVVDRVADLALEKSHDAADVRVGDALDFTLVVTNHGPSDSSGAVVTDSVPAGLTVLSEPGDLGNGWTIDSVRPGADGTTEVVASYAESIAVGEQSEPLRISTLVEAHAYPEVLNTAVVTPIDDRERDPEPSNDRAEDVVDVPPLVTLLTDKQAVGEFQVGGTGTYRITVENEGPTPDPGPITVTDRLPNGLAFLGSPNLPDGVTVEVRGGTVVWTLENGLAVGEQVEIALEVRIGQAAYPEVVNTVTVDSAAEKTPESVLQDDAVAPVAAADPLAITGGDLAALWLVLALLLLLAGGTLLLRRRRATIEA